LCGQIKVKKWKKKQKSLRSTKEPGKKSAIKIVGARESKRERERRRLRERGRERERERERERGRERERKRLRERGREKD
jgi:hypothetical protein